MVGIAEALGPVFGAVFGALGQAGTLRSVTATDDGAGGFVPGGTDLAVTVLVDSLSAQDRASGGLPHDAVRLTVLRAGLPRPIALDDTVAVGGGTYRVIAVDTDPASAAYNLVAVPL